MPEIGRLTGSSDYLELEFVEQEPTTEPAVKLGIQSHAAGLSLSDTTRLIAGLGIERA